MEDVTASDPEASLQIERRQHLAVLDDRADIGRVLLDQRDHAVAERFPQLVPGALAERVGRVLQEDAHDVLAGRGERRVVHRRDRQFEQRALGGAAVLGVVPRALHVVDARANVHRGAMVRAGCAGVGGELGQPGKREVDLATRAFDAEVADGRDELRVEVALLEQLEKCELGVEVRSDLRALELGAIVERYALRTPAADEDFRDGSAGANLHALCPRGCRDRFGHHSHAPAHEAP